MGTKGYRLRIKRLDFISAVDAGAQGPIANVALIKRATKPGNPPRLEKATCKVFKLDEKLGLVFGWAMVGTLDGGETLHIDHQDDAIDVTGDEFIKACADFMEAGAASDVMHDGRRDGKVVFAMPLVKGVNEALGIKSNVEGFAIAMKPSPATFKRFMSGELAAFSIGGIGDREPLPETKRAPLAKHLFSRILKEAVLTSDVDGHQHALDLDDPATSWCDMYSTSYQNAEGADNGHSHSWTFDEQSGVITIGTDSGHTHTVAAVVPPDALAAWLKLDAEQDAINAAIAAAPVVVVDDPSDGIPSMLPVEESSGKVISVVIAARQPASKSTPRTPAIKVATQPEIKSMNPKMLTALLAMTASQQAYVGKLAPDEVEPFLAKSLADRDAIFKSVEAADPVVFKGEKTGVEVHKSDGPFALKMAQNAETGAVELAKAQEQVATEKAARELVELTKRANDTLGCLAGTDGAHVDVLRAVEAIADTTKRDAAIATLKGANAAMKAAGKSAGVTHTGDPVAIDKNSAYAALNKALVPFCEEKKITKVWTDGLAAFSATPSGALLVKAYDDAAAAQATR